MPISKSTMQNVRNAYHKLSKLEEAVRKAEACEFDCDELKRRRADALKRLALINEVFGNDHPES